MNKIYAFLIAVSFGISPVTFSQGNGGGGGCTPTTSPSCATAVSLTSGDPCVNGTTCSGNGAGTPSACIGAGYECSWYSFVATAADMFVDIAMTANSGCHFRTEVFGGNCGSLTSLSCQSGAPLDDLHSLSGLTIGNTYYVQVCYAPGGPCGNGGSAEFCISVGEPDPPCDLCSTPCGTATGYATNPTVQDVVDDCQTSPFVPELQASSTHTFCYNFVASATSVDFNVIITSNCGAGNVTNFSWELYNSGCGAPIQTGTLASLTFSPVTVGNAYVFCYTFTVPSTCTHSQHCPFFVGATVPLPVEFLSFDGMFIDDQVELQWKTASETDCAFYDIERSEDGEHFVSLGHVAGAGTTQNESTYRFYDRDKKSGISYYRIKQVDTDGESVYTGILAVDRGERLHEIMVTPNPANKNAFLSFDSSSEDKDAIVYIGDIYGKELNQFSTSVSRGFNSIDLPIEELNEGVYLVSVSVNGETRSVRFMKN